MLFNDDIWKTLTEPFLLKKPKTLKLYPQIWYVIGNFLVRVECFISLEDFY